MLTIPNNPDNIELVAAATAKIKADEAKAKAEKKVVSAIAMKHRLIGFGALLLGLGASSGVGMAGYAHYLDRQADLRRPAQTLIEAFTKALSSTVIQTTATGNVFLDTTNAAPVKLNTAGSAVPLDANGVALRVEGSDIRQIIEIVEHYLNRRSASPAADQAHTSLDVVKSVRSPSGLEVVTRWEYAKDGDNAQAVVERCFVRPNATNSAERLLEIARDQRPGVRPKDISEQQFQEAIRHCVWSISVP